MLGEPPSLFAYWCRALDEVGFSGNRLRASLLAKFLVKNEMIRIKHLKFAVHPSLWDGAESFSASELDAVWNIRCL